MTRIPSSSPPARLSGPEGARVRRGFRTGVLPAALALVVGVPFGSAGQAVRDPFRPLAPEIPEALPGVLAGVRVREARLRGVLRRNQDSGLGAGGAFAILEAPDGVAFIAAPGARLRDGAVEEILDDAVWFSLDDGSTAGFTILLDGTDGSGGPDATGERSR